MKINCGLTGEERRHASRQWHDWFAWLPVRVGSRDCRWQEVVERRLVDVYYCGRWLSVWEYRSKDEAK